MTTVKQPWAHSVFGKRGAPGRSSAPLDAVLAHVQAGAPHPLSQLRDDVEGRVYGAVKRRIVALVLCIVLPAVDVHRARTPRRSRRARCRHCNNGDCWGSHGSRGVAAPVPAGPAAPGPLRAVSRSRDRGERGLIGRCRSPQGGGTGLGRVRTGRAFCAVEVVRPSCWPEEDAIGPPAEART